MLETMIFKSFAGTTSRTICSTCCTSWSGQFQARAGRRLDIDDELAGIGARKIRLADQRIQRQAQHENARDAQDRRQRPQQRHRQHALVAVEHTGEFRVEPGVETPAPTMHGRLRRRLLPDFLVGLMAA